MGRNKKNHEVTEIKEIRPRGRPKKIISTITQKQQILRLEQEHNDKSITLHIPLYDETTSDDVSEKNQFTMKDEDENVKNTDVKEVDNNNFIMYLSDEDDDNNDGYNTKNLKKMIKKQEEIIKKQKEEIENIKKSKEEVVNVIDTKMICEKLRHNNIVIGEKTKIACWWCSYNFDNMPCYIPEKYFDGIYYVFGCFCSFNCALAYILKDDEYKLQNRISLIKKMYKELYNQNNELFPSPQKELLEKYGGTVTINEYRKNLDLIKICNDKQIYNNIMKY